MIKDKEGLLKKQILKYGDVKGKKVLEIGFGDGKITKFISNFAKSVKAIENDKKLVEEAKKAIARKNISFNFRKAQKFRFEDETFDSVLFIKSLHHIPIGNQFKALVESKRVLRKNGNLLIIEPVYKGGAYEEIDSIYNDEKVTRNHAKKSIQKSLEKGLFTKKVEKIFKITYSCTGFEDLFNNSINPKRWKSWKPSFKSKVLELLEKNKKGKQYVLDYQLKLYLLRRL